MHYFIDAMNVIGARPDGWWRDRDGAARRLIEEIRAWAEEDVTVVLDAGPDDLLGTRVTSSEVRACEDGGRNTISVVRARRRGRDAADDEIVRLVTTAEAPVRVVTSDATLAARVRALGAEVEGAGSFRARLASSR